MEESINTGAVWEIPPTACCCGHFHWGAAHGSREAFAACRALREKLEGLGIFTAVETLELLDRGDK